MDIQTLSGSKLKFVVTVSIFTGLGSIAHASESFNFVGGIKVSAGPWEGQNQVSTEDATSFKTDGRLWTLTAAYQKGPWLGAISAGSGRYDYSGVSPDLYPAENYDELIDAKTVLSEFDIAFGYRIWPRLYPIFGFKRYGMTYQDSFNNEHTKEYAGYSVGLSANYPLGKRFLLFGSLTAESMNISYESTDIGDSQGTAFEFGSAYYLSNRSLIQLSIEAHGLKDKYQNGLEQTHSMGGLTLGYQHRFGK